MAAIQDLVEPIAALVTNAPEQAIIEAYRRAAREFCTKTRSYKLTLDPIAAAENQGVYTLNPGTGVEVFDATQCKYGAHVFLEKRTREQMKWLLNGRTNAKPEYYRIAGVNVLVVQAAPPAAGENFELEALARPTRSATELDDELVAKHGDTIEEGALGYLLRQPRQAWTDYNASRIHLAFFLEEIDKQTALAADDGNVGVVRRVRYGGIQ